MTADQPADAHGVPDEYRVLILPACLCLSDAEAKQIKTFCRTGGTVIADYLPALWDQHGKGRAGGGALDDLFGVKQDPHLRAADVFNGESKNLWAEVDQEANFSTRNPEKFLTNANTCLKDESGFNKAVRNQPTQRATTYGKGKAILMNLSPQWYNAYRAAGPEAATKRDVFIRPVVTAIVTPHAALKNPTAATFGAELTYFRKGAREIVFVCQNPELTGSETGGGNAAGLKTETVHITVKLPQKVQNARDERTGKDLGAGDEFGFDWPMNQTVVLSFDAPTAR